MNENACVSTSGEVQLRMVMRASSRLSAKPFTRWAVHQLFSHVELFRVHVSRRIYLTLTMTGSALVAVRALWIVTLHLIAPVLITLRYMLVGRIGILALGAIRIPTPA